MLAVSLLALTLGSTCDVTPRYYILIFGGLAERTRPNTAHTWATFVEAGFRSDQISVEEFTISWLPEKMPVKPFAPATQGRNYGLHETFKLYCNAPLPICLWGPYEISPSFYQAASDQRQRLDSGQILYRVFDGDPIFRGVEVRKPQYSHCVHAITRADEQLRQRSKPIFWYGALITRRVVLSMNDCGLFIEPWREHDWLVHALDLKQYRIYHRKLPRTLSQRLFDFE